MDAAKLIPNTLPSRPDILIMFIAIALFDTK